MNLSLNIPAEKDRTVRATLAIKAHSSDAHAFSKWWHYALILAPTVAAQIYLQLHDYFSMGKFPEWLGYTNYAKRMIQIDYSGWWHLWAIAMFIGGVGAAVGLLYGIGLVEAMEERNQK